MGTSAYPLQPELGFLLYRCFCKIEKITDLIRDAVFISPEGDVHVLGLVLPAEWHLTGTKGSCDYFSTSPCMKKRDAVLQGATEAWWMECPSPIPPLGTELVGSCTLGLQTNNYNNQAQTKPNKTTTTTTNQPTNQTTQTNQTNQKTPKQTNNKITKNRFTGGFLCIKFLALTGAKSTQPIVLCGFSWGCSATRVACVLSRVDWRWWGGQLCAGAHHAACSS